MTTSKQPPARQVAPGALEELGKQAARLSATSGLSLTEAVVRTLGKEKLSAEQIRRVVEFCNIDAVNQKFASSTGVNRITHIDGGPADPAMVISALRAASAPADVRIEALEYSLPPQYGIKTSSYVPEVKAPNLWELRDKLAAAHEEIVGQCESAAFQMEEALMELKQAARTAGLEGATLSELFLAWQEVDPALAKVAAHQLQGTLTWGQKLASRRISAEHPVMRTFDAFAKQAARYHQANQARREVEAQSARVAEYMTRFVS